MARILWRYAGCTRDDGWFTISFWGMFGDPDKQLDDLYQRVTRLARYMRQDVDKIWGWPVDEVTRYERAMSVIIAEENGSGGGDTPPVPGGDWHFGDYDGGG